MHQYHQFHMKATHTRMIITATMYMSRMRFCRNSTLLSMYLSFVRDRRNRKTLVSTTSASLPPLLLHILCSFVYVLIYIKQRQIYPSKTQQHPLPKTSPLPVPTHSSNQLFYPLTILSPTLPSPLLPLLKSASHSAYPLPAPNPSPTQAGHARLRKISTEKTIPKPAPSVDLMRRFERQRSHCSDSHISN